jgi:endonuclease/exonuclease/phosphatase family metal-dependent hydrolase
MSLLSLLVACGQPIDADSGLELTAMTFNTGTTQGLGHDAPPDDGYGEEEAAISDTWYGDGLAWQVVVDDTRATLATLQPDVVAFQEIFWSGACPDIPSEQWPGFVCAGWQEGDPTVAEVILGADYQVACHQGKWDKCIAVRRDFAEIRGCNDDLCLDALDGAEVSGCGSGSRVGRAIIDLTDGGQITVVNAHGSSGLTAEDEDCRVRQFALVFDDMDGAPAANGQRNLVLGDFNTDPGRNTSFDASAAYLADQRQEPWRFHTAVGPDAEPTYAGLFNIDHVMSDAFSGDCEAVTTVSDVLYFDHQPLLCSLSARRGTRSHRVGGTSSQINLRTHTRAAD